MLTKLEIDRRTIRSEMLAAQIMLIVGPYISDFDGQRQSARDELFAAFYDADVEITTRSDRDLAAAFKRIGVSGQSSMMEK